MAYVVLLIFYLVFGLVFYDLPYFQMVDEIFPFIIFAASLILKKNVHRHLIVFGCIIAFYIAYSLLIKSNIPTAIIFDAVCFSKAFLTFFSVLVLNPKITPKESLAIRIVILAMIPILIYAGINVHITKETISGQLLSGARFAFCCVYLGMSYYLFSNHRRKDFIVMMFYIFLGFLFPTSKFLASFMAICMIFFLTQKKKIRFNYKTIIVLSVSVIAMIFLSLEDIVLYLSEDVARGAMYLTSFRIFMDRFPFGSGLASFSTPASATFYSDTYFEYSLDGIHGLSPSDTSFISDAFLPALAEFGVMGLILSVVFIAYLFKRVAKCRNKAHYRIGMSIAIGMVIESVSDVSIIGNRGVYAMMLLGYILSANRFEHIETQTGTADENSAH